VATRSLKRTCADPQTGVAPREDAGAAMCVRSVDDQCVLQFTLVHAAGCVLHRRTSRVIHRRELFSYFDFAMGHDMYIYLETSVRAGRQRNDEGAGGSTPSLRNRGATVPSTVGPRQARRSNTSPLDGRRVGRPTPAPGAARVLPRVERGTSAWRPMTAALPASRRRATVRGIRLR
jgi:hypothetical protein